MATTGDWHTLSGLYPCFSFTYMALQIGSEPGEWESIFIKAGISVASTKLYVQILASEKLTKNSLLLPDHSELGIQTLGEMLAKLNFFKEPPASPPPLTNYEKIPIVKIPQLHLEMTAQQFQKFKIDWDIFTKMTNFSFTVEHSTI